MSRSDYQTPLASRGGLKLEAALDAMGLSVAGLPAADLGSATGGFVDVLLRRGAKRVYAVEKGFGRLDWRLRNDSRVVVLERHDATTVSLPEVVDVITVDAGFTKQRDLIPHASTLLSPSGYILSLLKPQYEVSGRELIKGRLTDELSEKVALRVIRDLQASGVHIQSTIRSPVRGKDASALEYFLLIRPSLKRQAGSSGE